MPVKHFIAACNANDVIPVYLRTGDYRPAAARPTLSNAMDVGNPSNFVRILELFDHQLPSLQYHPQQPSASPTQKPSPPSRDLHTRYHYLRRSARLQSASSPLQRYLSAHPGAKGIFLETAHPVKFYDVVEPLIGSTIPLPASVKFLLNRKKQSIRISIPYIRS